MNVQIIIAAYKDSIFKVSKVCSSLPDSVPVLVVHQIPDGNLYDYDTIFNRRLLEVQPVDERGLARSRNRGLECSGAEIVVPTDDDVEFVGGAVKTIDSAFREFRDAGVLSFQVLGPDHKTYKSYSDTSFRHNLSTIRRVFSVELAVRRESAWAAGLKWDEDFGLNARFPGGLEQAFMKNCLDLKVPAWYVPKPIVIHPADATGYHHTPESAIFRGAVYAKLYGRVAYLLLALFAARNAWRAGSLSNRLVYARNLYRGASQYLNDL